MGSVLFFVLQAICSHLAQKYLRQPWLSLLPSGRACTKYTKGRSHAPASSHWIVLNAKPRPCVVSKGLLERNGENYVGLKQKQDHWNCFLPIFRESLTALPISSAEEGSKEDRRVKAASHGLLLGGFWMPSGLEWDKGRMKKGNFPYFLFPIPPSPSNLSVPGNQPTPLHIIPLSKECVQASRQRGLSAAKTSTCTSSTEELAKKGHFACQAERKKQPTLLIPHCYLGHQMLPKPYVSQSPVQVQAGGCR